MSGPHNYPFPRRNQTAKRDVGSTLAKIYRLISKESILNFIFYYCFIYKEIIWSAAAAGVPSQLSLLCGLSLSYGERVRRLRLLRE